LKNTILRADPGTPEPSRSLATRSVERALERRRAAYAHEVERLVAASFALIRERGELEPKVGEIVRAAGLSNQAFYRHFRSKDELLVTVLDAGIRQLGDYLAHRMQTATSPRQRIERFVRGVAAQALDPDAARASRPFALSRARLAEHFPAEVAASEQLLTRLLRGAIAEALDAGALIAADPERDAALLYDLCMGWLQRALANAEPASEADAEHLLAFALRGLHWRAG
jgi:AcrR family transcriptional regulator